MATIEKHVTRELMALDEPTPCARPLRLRRAALGRGAAGLGRAHVTGRPAADIAGPHGRAAAADRGKPRPYNRGAWVSRSDRSGC